MSDPKKHLKLIAKRLLKSQRRALGQEGLELLGDEAPTLMKMQHRVALDYGFESWDKVVQSSPEAVQQAISGKKTSSEKVMLVLGQADSAAILHITDELKRHVDYSSFGSIVDFLKAPDSGIHVWEGAVSGEPGSGTFEGTWRRPTVQELVEVGLEVLPRMESAVVVDDLSFSEALRSTFNEPGRILFEPRSDTPATHATLAELFRKMRAWLKERPHAMLIDADTPPLFGWVTYCRTDEGEETKTWYAAVSEESTAGLNPRVAMLLKTKEGRKVLRAELLDTRAPKRCRNLIEVFARVRQTLLKYPDGQVEYYQDHERLSLGYIVRGADLFESEAVLGYFYMRISGFRGPSAYPIKGPQDLKELPARLQTGERFWKVQETFFHDAIPEGAIPWFSVPEGHTALVVSDGGVAQAQHRVMVPLFVPTELPKFYQDLLSEQADLNGGLAPQEFQEENYAGLYFTQEFLSGGPRRVGFLIFVPGTVEDVPSLPERPPQYVSGTVQSSSS